MSDTKHYVAKVHYLI